MNANDVASAPGGVNAYDVVSANDIVNAGGVAGIAALLLFGAVLVWPGRRPLALAPADLAARAIPGRDPVAQADTTVPSLWHQDPVELYRRWRLRRRTGELVDDVLDLLRGIRPALEAGLTPARSIELAASSALGVERVTRAREAAGRARRRRPSRRRAGSRTWRPAALDSETHDRGVDGDGATSGERAADVDLLVGALLTAAEQGERASPVWAHWAGRSGSAELALVAAAWQLSETTGAPLSFAVERAVRGLLDARTRRGKVAVAVAGPRATITVLTLLPLTGPLFGLACGIDPGTLYLGSPLATACVVAGLGLVWAGRFWCTRMVHRAVRS